MVDQDHFHPEQPGTGDATAGRGVSYVEFVSEALMRQTVDLGRTWARRGAAAVGVPGGEPGGDGAGIAADTTPVEELVRTLALAAAEERQWHERVMRTGWAAGTDALRRGTSLNQLLKELDAGVSLVLRAADTATREFAGATTAVEGLALARRILDAASLLRLAAAGGYTRAMVDELRQRYRTIRHDLRNPLGTITTAVALMDDESVPEETRRHPRVRAMVARNARSMDAMISASLGDPAAQLPAIALQTTSLRALACAVQGDLRATIDGVKVTVGSDLPTFPFDSAGLELLLKAVVIAIARSAGRQVDIVIDLAELGARAAKLAVYAADGAGSAASPEVDLSFARELAGRLGGRVSVSATHHVLIDFPVERVTSPAHPAQQARGDSGDDARNDVAGEGERAHRQAGTL